MNTPNSNLRDRSFYFTLSIIQLYQNICDQKHEYVLSKQILRSGTSVGANIREAKNAESTNDFVHKLGIAQKECDETLYWLDLLKGANYITMEIHSNLFDEGTQIYKMIRRSILTTKAKQRNR
jgi:four helix bundle protein